MENVITSFLIFLGLSLLLSIWCSIWYRFYKKEERLEEDKSYWIETYKLFDKTIIISLACCLFFLILKILFSI